MTGAIHIAPSRWQMIAVLLRKELHEWWSAIALGCFTIGGFVAIGLQSRLIPDEAVLIGMVISGGLIFPLICAMPVVAAERAEGSVNLLLRLPAPAWLVLAVKTAVAVVGVIVPLLLALAIMGALAGYREVRPNIFWALFLLAGLMAVNVLMWTMCLGIRQPNEARVGLIGAAVCIGTVMTMFFIDDALSNEQMVKAIAAWTPVGLFAVLDGSRSEEFVSLLLGVAARHVVVLSLLWAYAAWRFSQPGRTRG